MSARFMKVVKSARRGRLLARRFRRQFSWFFLAFCLTIFGSAWLVWSQEHKFGGTYFDALWSVLFTLIGQGEFATNPKTIPGRIIVFFLSVIGIALLGVILSEIMQRLMTSKLKEMMGMSRCKYEGHTIICGWNDRGRLILRELLAAGSQVAVIASDRPSNLPSGDVFFIAGSPADDEILRRAGILKANAAIILADHAAGISANDIDARTILIALTVEADSPSIYSVIELLNPENERHARLAKVDDIIYCDSLIAEVTATCAVNAGISVFIRDILCASDEGHRLVAFDIPEEFEGKETGGIFDYFKKDGYLPVGIITPPEENRDAPPGQWVSMINPKEDLSVFLPAKVVCIMKNENNKI